MTILSESSGLKLTMNIQMPGLGQRREAEEEAVGAISLQLRDEALEEEASQRHLQELPRVVWGEAGWPHTFVLCHIFRNYL